MSYRIDSISNERYNQLYTRFLPRTEDLVKSVEISHWISCWKFLDVFGEKMKQYHAMHALREMVNKKFVTDRVTPFQIKPHHY
jgi:hypothetical protein